MRYLFSLILLTGITQLKANTYYFSTNSGNDSRSAFEARNAATPWKTLAKLNAIFGDLNAGDSVLFKRNEIYIGAIIAAKSGALNLPIVFAAYGTGAKPVITGLTTLTGWTNIGNGIWESSCPSSAMVNRVLMNGEIKEIGRYPNLSAPNKGYLTMESSNGIYQFTDNDLPASPDWTGGEVVIRKARWVIDRNLITRHSGNTIDYSSESSYSPDPSAGYFIQNHPKTLDITGEWYYRLSDQKLGIYFENGDPASRTIQASTVNKTVVINALSGFAFDNINFIGANSAAFEIINSQAVRISNCDILYSGLDAVYAKNSTQLTFENLLINHSNNVALNLDNCSNLVIRGNRIKNTGITAGTGKGDSGGYEGILLSGDNVLIEQNEIDSSGYIGITFRGNLNVMKNNFISNFGFVKDDASGIYTWNNIPNAPLTYGTKITNNVIINGIGAPEGTQWPTYRPVSGLYIDDNTANVEITGNTISECRLYGIYIHNAHDLSLDKNTFFNSNCQLGITEDSHAAYSMVRNVTMHDNIFFAREFYYRVAEFKTSVSDINEFGVFDNNYYCRPTYEKQIIYPSYLLNQGYVENSLNLEEWKAMFGKDLSSKKAPVELPNSDYVRFEYNSTGTAKTVPLDDTYIDVKNNVYSGSVTIDPYSSIILLRHAGVTITTPPSTCPDLGSIQREEWDNISGNDISRIPLSNTPDKVSQLSALETVNSGEMFGARVRGYICPPLSGNYTFLIAGDDQVELWLSTDENPDNKKKIASLLSWTGLHEFKKFPSQTSAEINLQAGKRYYIEVLHKEGDGGDHFSVAWVLPNGLTEAPIPGNRLSPLTSNPIPPTVVNGLNYKYYEGDWNQLPDFKALTPVKTGTTPNVDISVRNPGVNDYFGFVWEGYITIPTAGNYTFETVSDDGSKLYFNSFYSFTANPLVSYDGLHAPWPATGNIYIAAPGIYPISMAFFEKNGGELMQVYWTGPGIQRQLIPNSAFTNNVVVSDACPGTGNILQELWNNVAGDNVPSIPLETAPNSSAQINMLETNNIGDFYGERIRGYLCPPQNGAYKFFISGDDAVHLWLSTDENPANKVKIAGFAGWTDFHQFDKFSSQQSAPVNLQAGHRYYIEVLHKEGAGRDHVTVAWQLPDGITETPIRGNRLVPYTNNATVALGNNTNQLTIQSEHSLPGNEWSLTAYPNPFKVSSTIVLNPIESGEINLEIYDLQGRKLKRLPTRMVKEGIRETFVLNSEGLSSGVYMIRLATKTKVIFQKIVLSR